jgi:hypothetical protein
MLRKQCASLITGSASGDLRSEQSFASATFGHAALPQRLSEL